MPRPASGAPKPGVTRSGWELPAATFACVRRSKPQRGPSSASDRLTTRECEVMGRLVESRSLVAIGTTLESGEPLAAVPKVIGQLYHVEIPAQGGPQTRRLGVDGLFSPAPAPEWMTARHCSGFAIEEPPALVLPVYAIATTESRVAAGTLVRKTVRWQHDRCFVAQVGKC